MPLSLNEIDPRDHSLNTTIDFSQPIRLIAPVQSGQNSFKQNKNWNIDSGGGYNVLSNRRSILRRLQPLNGKNVENQVRKRGTSYDSSVVTRFRLFRNLYPEVVPEEPPFITERISVAQAIADGIPADGDPPVSNVVDNCWEYSNDGIAPNKINWYMYADLGTPATFKFEDLEAFYFVVKLNSGTTDPDYNKPWITLYTQAEGDGKDASWYRTRYSYAGLYDQGATYPLTQDQKYLFYIGDLTKLTTYDMSLDSYNLNDYDAKITINPANTTPELDKVFLIAISTDSTYPANRFDFCVSEVGYKYAGQKQVVIETTAT